MSEENCVVVSVRISADPASQLAALHCGSLAVHKRERSVLAEICLHSCVQSMRTEAAKPWVCSRDWVRTTQLK